MHVRLLCGIENSRFAKGPGKKLFLGVSGVKEGSFEIGIIGGAGGMGSWCSDILRGQGYRVHAAGRKSGMAVEEMARRCSVVIVSVPIEATLSVIDRVGPLLSDDSLLMDLTSVKEAPVRAMLSSTGAEVMGCHPLFGPRPDSADDLSVVLCPARVDRWASWPSGVFAAAGIKVIETTPEEHDRVMAVVQGLNHLDTILMALTLGRCGIERLDLERFATPLFRSRLAALDRVMAGNHRMYAEIICSNPRVASLIEEFEKILGELRGYIEKGDGAGFAARTATARLAKVIPPVED